MIRLARLQIRRDPVRARTGRGRPAPRPWLAWLAALCVSLTSLGAQTLAPERRGGFSVQGGEVRASEAYGGVLLLGGSFERLGISRPPSSLFDAASGAPLYAAFPSSNDPLMRRRSDGTGGWFVFGAFTTLGGQPRSGLARVLANGQVDLGFAPVITSQGSTSVLWAELAGSTLWIGGRFDAVAGQPRAGIAALDATTGALLPWTTNLTQTPNFWNPTGAVSVHLIRIHASRLYILGTFDAAHGSPRDRVASLDATTGAVLPWDLGVPGNLLGDIYPEAHRVWVAGSFTSLNAQPAESLALTDPVSGALLSGAPAVNGPVRRLARHGDTLYFGGNFSQVGVATRPSVAGISLADPPIIRPFAPLLLLDPNNSIEVSDFSFQGNTVYLAGEFTTLQHDAPSVAAFDASSSAQLPFAPDPLRQPFASYSPILESAVTGIDAGPDGVFVAGPYRELRAEPAAHLAGIDVASGLPALNLPSVDDEVLALSRSGDTLYIGGRFENVGGLPRRHAAAIDLVSGAVLPWDPSPNGPVHTLHALPSGVHLSGEFLSLAGGVRFGFGTVNPLTGGLDAWNPMPIPAAPVTGPIVQTMASDETTLYLGGRFVSIAGASRHGIAAFDRATRTLLSFAPTPNVANVSSLRLSGEQLYFGGRFEVVDGQPRSRLAAVHRSTGQLFPWTSSIDWNGGSQPSGLEVIGHELWVSGRFPSVGGAAHPQLVGLDRLSGASTPSPLTRTWARGVIRVGGTLCCFGSRTATNDTVGFHDILAPAASSANLAPACGFASVTLTTGAPRVGEIVPLSVTSLAPGAQTGTLFGSLVPPATPPPLGWGCPGFLDPTSLVPLAAIALSAGSPWESGLVLPPDAALMGAAFRLRAALLPIAGSPVPVEISNGIQLSFGF